MMGRFLRLTRPILMVLLFFPVIAFGRDAGVPEIHAPEPFWDYGVVPMDYNLVHYFRIENKGTADLHIHRVYSNCDCTAAGINDTITPPRGFALVRVDFKTTDYYGSKIRDISVESNDPQMPLLRLEYGSNIGDLPTNIGVAPQSLFFLPANKAKEFQLVNKTGRTLPFKLLVEADSLFSISRDTGKIDGNESIPVIITVNENIKAGTYHSSLAIIFGDKEQFRTTFPIKIVRF